LGLIERRILTEIDEEPSVAFALIRRQGQDARDVVVEERVLLLEKGQKKKEKN
jgi:hypothetical protein